jgi:signal transduction histidine kinase
LRGTTKQAERLRDLFRALKPLAGGKRGHPKRFNPNQVIIDTFSLFDGKFLEGQVKKVHRDTTGGKDILGYGEDLATAMTNIVDNALFWLGYHKVEKPMLTVTVDNESKYCVIKIADNGTGIPDEFRHNIFDVGFSLKPQGTGLGLSIAQEAIGRSKGTITLDDISPGTGFTIRIPYGA